MLTSPRWRRGRVALLAVLVIAIVVAGLWWIQDDFRGGASPQEVADRYVAAMREGDEFAAVWLMHPDREDGGRVAERIKRYRPIANEPLEVELVPHSVAAYLVGAKVHLKGALFDEVVIQHLSINRWSGRWFIVHFWDPGEFPPPSPGPIPTAVPGPTPP